MGLKEVVEIIDTDDDHDETQHDPDSPYSAFFLGLQRMSRADKPDKQEYDRIIQKFVCDCQALDPEGLHVLKYFWAVSYFGWFPGAGK